MPGYGEQGAQDLLVGFGTIMYNDPPMDIRVVEQIVPSRVCYTCDVCCRFPERDSPLRLYFTREEMQAAITRGASAAGVTAHAGAEAAQIRAVLWDRTHRPAREHRCDVGSGAERRDSLLTVGH